MTKKQAINRMIAEATDRLYYMTDQDVWYEGDYEDAEAALLLSITGRTYNQTRMSELYELLQRSVPAKGAESVRDNLIAWVEKKVSEGYRI